MESAPSSLLTEAEQFVQLIFASGAGDGHSYHTMEHTIDVVERTREIGTACGLTPEELETAELGAWFHDIGHTEMFEGHEERSAQIAAEFLKTRGASSEKVAGVVACILATRVPQQPANRVEQVLCDADMAHLGTKNFAAHGELLRRELATRLGRTFTDAEWLQHNIAFLSRQRFHTEYASERYDRRRQKNVAKMRSELAALLAGRIHAGSLEAVTDLPNEPGNENPIDDTTAAARPGRKKGKRSLEGSLSNHLDSEAKSQKNERGIETMFRTTSRNHLELSAMADNKANIIIGVNAVVITIVVALVVRRIDDVAGLMIPTLILLGFCLAVVIIASIATRPTITSGTFTPEDVRQKKVNLLFFGNFHRVPLEEYEWGMKEMMADRDYLYGSMIKDIYFLGQVLARKYRYVRLAYNVFVFGLAVSVVAFVIVILLNAAY